MKVVNVEVWKQIEYDTRYQVSNYGRFRKKNLKNGYRYLKPFRKHKRSIYVANEIIFDLQDRIDEAIEYIEERYHIKGTMTYDSPIYHKDLLEILKGSDKE